MLTRILLAQSHGFGLEYYASGSIYQGQFERDCRHGLGIYTWSSGLSYGGTWLKGIQHGEGVETNINLPIDPGGPKPLRRVHLFSLPSFSIEPVKTTDWMSRQSAQGLQFCSL